MKKEYTVLFKEADGYEYEFKFVTADIENSIREYSRNRSIVTHQILQEGSNNKKQMLFG
tara:strand:+ start:7855 stop:8031 length:177 start_codon:yes stop_codon:yes gene_type:complete